MENLTIWIDYHPRLYQDLIYRVFQQISQWSAKSKINIITEPYLDKLVFPRWVDVAILSLDMLYDNYPETRISFSTDSKIIAFSPMGICGWIFKRRIGRWDLIYPLGLSRLLSEVLGSAWYI